MTKAALKNRGQQVNNLAAPGSLTPLYLSELPAAICLLLYSLTPEAACCVAALGS
jgi:hypothetical protein